MSDHMVMFTIIIGIAAVSAVGALGSRFGADTRPGFDERPEPQMHRFIP
jgi:hypothetical protein